MLWSIVSNAFCKSIRTSLVKRPELKPFVILLWMHDKQVSFEWNFRKPDWYLHSLVLHNLVHSLIMNNLFYNLIDKWKQQDGSEVLWVSFEPYFIQRFNFCDFTFIWGRGEFDGKITYYSKLWTGFKTWFHVINCKFVQKEISCLKHVMWFFSFLSLCIFLNKELSIYDVHTEGGGCGVEKRARSKLWRDAEA